MKFFVHFLQFGPSYHQVDTPLAKMYNSHKNRLLCSLVLVIVLLGCLQNSLAWDEDFVTIYMNSDCKGPEEYKLQIERGRCINLPNWITFRENRVSMNPEGYCLRMFETNGCKVSILRGTKKPKQFNSCKNPRELGMGAFKSFIIVPC